MRLFLLFAIALLCSCSRQEQSSNIKTLSFGDNNEFDINDVMACKFIPLETSEDCLISKVEQIIINENKIYINSGKDKLLVFDTSGKFITQIGNKGNGPGEYRSIWNFHVDNKKQILTVADAGQNRIIYYSLGDYRHIETKTLFYFTDCCWLSDNNIAWLFWGGYESKDKDRYYIKITDERLNELKLLHPLDYKFTYPVLCGSQFYTLNQKSYLNLPYTPAIYEITSQSITPSYRLSLGQHKFAPSEWMEKEAERDYSAIVQTDYISSQNVKETDNYISVSYYAKGANAFIGFYNKKTGQSCKYPLPEFIRHTGLTGTDIVVDTFKDSFITCLDASVLKRYPNSKIAKLKIISENINEEDNPVICFIKL